MYYDSIGYLLSLMSKMLSGNYKNNFNKKIKFWDSLIWLSKIIDMIFYFYIPIIILTKMYMILKKQTIVVN